MGPTSSPAELIQACCCQAPGVHPPQSVRLPSWRQTNEAFEGFVSSLRDKAMVAP